MNNVKELIKHFFGKIRSLKFGISAEKNVYIGKHCDFKGKKNIQLKRDVTIRPYVQIWSGGGTVKILEGSEIGERCRISIANSLEIGKKCFFHLMYILLIVIMSIEMLMLQLLIKELIRKIRM